MMLQQYCFSNAFFYFGLLVLFPPFPQLHGNTGLQAVYWVKCGIPIGTLVVIGMTGVVHWQEEMGS